MADTKYGHLVKPLPVQKFDRDWANATQLVWMMGKDLNDFEVNFAWGAYNKTGNWHEWVKEGGGPHTHPYDEVLCFVGHNTDDLTYLGAELEMTMGEEQEKYVFDKASYVVVPKGMIHCPITALRVDEPYSHYHIALGAKYDTKWLSLENTPAQPDGGKYAHLVKPMKIKTFDKDWANANQLAWMMGKDLEGFNLNFTWGVYSGLGDWESGRDPHVHPYDELLVFVGHDTDDLTYLGAEIELHLGEEEEEHIIDKSSVVIVPKGMVHCPVITKSVEKPFGFFLIALNHKMEYKWLGKGK